MVTCIVPCLHRWVSAKPCMPVTWSLFSNSFICLRKSVWGTVDSCGEFYNVQFFRMNMLSFKNWSLKFWASQVVVMLFSRSVVHDSVWPHGQQHARLPCPSVSPRVCSNSCPLSQWYQVTILASASLFSFRLQSFPASGSLQVKRTQWNPIVHKITYSQNYLLKSLRSLT